MPIQAPQWTEYLSCPVCENGFEVNVRLPISLGCGHTVCKTCLSNLQRNLCPFDQCGINIPLNKLPVNTALTLLLDSDASPGSLATGYQELDHDEGQLYEEAMAYLEKLAILLRPSNNQQLSRPMQRKLVTLINCQPLEEEGRSRAVRAARSLGERSVTELILQHQNPQQLSANLWAAVRTRGCQFLGPAMQEEVLKLVLLALEDGSALSRKVLVMFVVQRLEPQFPQASKTSIGHVVQLLYRASCFKVTKREGDSSLMQLKEEFRTYETLRREHDAQIVQIATEAGLRIAPDQWSSLLYGDAAHKSHMQSIIDKLQTPQSFLQSVQELVIALQRTGDPGKLTTLREHLDFLSSLDPNPENANSDWDALNRSLMASEKVVVGLLTYMSQFSGRRPGGNHTTGGHVGQEGNSSNSRYKTSMCRDLTVHGSCPRGKNCTFAHSMTEMDQHRQKGVRTGSASKGLMMTDLMAKTGPKRSGPTNARPSFGRQSTDQRQLQLPQAIRGPPLMPASPCVTPVAQVAPVPRGYNEAVTPVQPSQSPQMMSMVRYRNNQIATAQEAIGHPQGLAVALPVPGNQGQNVLIPHPQQLSPGHGQLGFAPIPVVVQPNPHDQQQQLQLTPVEQPQFHSQQLYYHTVEDVQIPDLYDLDGKKHEFTVPGTDATQKVVTKSLSALKTRKEEIIDSLQDIVGEEGVKKIQSRTEEMASTLQKSAITPSSMPSAPSQIDNYSLWTSRVFTPFAKGSEEEDAPVKQIDVVPPTISTEEFAGTTEEEIIPFSDTPTICRFGPISRRSGRTPTIHTYKTSQTQAVIDDEPQPTPVVMNSKQMARPAQPSVPPIAYLQSANGNLTALQPVAMGVNGEIGYLTRPASAVSATQGPESLELRHIGLHTSHPSQHNELYAESERMKHELEILQRKISSLNLAKINGTNTTVEVTEPDRPPTASSERNEEMDMLTTELQLIENTIKDREMEISINHQISNQPHPLPQPGLDYGSYTNQGMYTTDDRYSVSSAHSSFVCSGTSSGGITTIARSGQSPRSTGRFFEPF